MLRTALLAAAMASAFPAQADTELDALRTELHELKATYETRIQALEARLRAAEAAALATPQMAAAAPRPAGRSFNPDISLILQGRYAHLDDVEHRAISGFLPAGHGHGLPRGFSLDHTEFVMSASVDPYFNGYFNLALVDEEVEIEEAWFQTTSLGHGISLKGGRFLSGIGYQNVRHPHAWDFADNNLMYRVLFGEAYGNDGLQLKWVAPTDLFMEFGAEAGHGAEYPGTNRNRNGAGSYALFGHLGGDAGISHSWRAGLSYLHAKARNREGELEDLDGAETETRFTGASKTWIADFVWKWAPGGNARARNASFAAEYFRREETGQLGCDDLDPLEPSLCSGGMTGDYAATQSGFYAQGVLQFMPRWRTGYRYDRLDPGSVDLGANSASLPVTDYRPVRHSLMLDYSPSEFSRLRVQYSRDRSMEDTRENQWFVQYIHSLGAHGAHTF
ncbi:MAG TPA: TonB-dependent receptor [Thiobacillaceae bacterium]|nr:TonB-dependent receptor [Thiobacillaceae bacterium]